MPEQLSIDGGSRRIGRVRRGVDAQVRALKKNDRLLDEDHAALTALIRATADHIDLRLRASGSFAAPGLSQLMKELRIQLRELGDDNTNGRNGISVADLFAQGPTEAPDPEDALPQ